MDRLIKKLIDQPTRPTSEQLHQLTRQVAAAPFAEDLLEVDEPLWGGFWQGDVLAPGYRLPAVELALLRAIRLDGHWPAGTRVDQYLTDLRQAILDPGAGIWTLKMIGQPCVVFAAGSGEREAKNGERLMTVVWYCAITGRLHAGYRTHLGGLNLAGAREQHRLELTERLKPLPEEQPGWITNAAIRINPEATLSLAAQLDAEILRMRAGG